MTDRIIKERGEKETGGRKRGENAKQTEAARWSEGKKILPIVDFTTQRLYERERAYRYFGRTERPKSSECLF